MNTNEHELILREEVFDVVGCAMEVLNGLRHGLLEKPYENALVVRSHRFEGGAHPELQAGETGMEKSCVVKKYD